MSRARVFKRGAVLMSAEVDADLVALDTSRGLCFGLNAPAAAIYALACRGLSEPDIVAALTETFAVEGPDCAPDVAEMLDELCREGLLTAAVAGGP